MLHVFSYLFAVSFSAGCLKPLVIDYTKEQPLGSVCWSDRPACDAKRAQLDDARRTVAERSMSRLDVWSRQSPALSGMHRMAAGAGSLCGGLRRLQGLGVYPTSLKANSQILATASVVASSHEIVKILRRYVPCVFRQLSNDMQLAQIRLRFSNCGAK